MTSPMIVSDSNVSLVQVAAPAAGAEQLYTFVQRGELIAVYTTLAASAVVANRLPILVLDTGTSPNTYYQMRMSNSAQTASNTVMYAGLTTVGAPGGVNSNHYYPIPGKLIVQPGWRIRTLTNGLDAGDQWSTLNLMIAI